MVLTTDYLEHSTTTTAKHTRRTVFTSALTATKRTTSGTTGKLGERSQKYTAALSVSNVVFSSNGLAAGSSSTAIGWLSVAYSRVGCFSTSDDDIKILNY